MSFVTLTKCDFCRRTTENPVIGHWFVVNNDLHACSECGHGIIDILVAIQVPFNKRCTMYTPGVEEMGWIRYSDVMTVVPQVFVNKFAAKLRRAG